MILEARGLRKGFGRGHARVEAVVDASLHVAPGELVLVMGPSGGGKTTLLSMLGCLARPDHGDVAIEGLRVGSIHREARAAIRRSKIGYVFQNFQLLENLTARENVEAALNIRAVKGRAAKQRARQLLEQVGLGHRQRMLPDQLSGGEKQRVAFARALANDPRIILADEPTANLDRATGHQVVELLRNWTRQGRRGALIVSHDPRIRDVADRVYTMEDGRLILATTAIRRSLAMPSV